SQRDASRNSDWYGTQAAPVSTEWSSNEAERDCAELAPPAGTTSARVVELAPTSANWQDTRLKTNHFVRVIKSPGFRVAQHYSKPSADFNSRLCLSLSFI